MRRNCLIRRNLPGNGRNGFSESRCGRVSEGITITAFICLRIWRCRGVTGCGKGVQLLYFGDTHVKIDLQGHRLFGLCLLSFCRRYKVMSAGEKTRGAEKIVSCYEFNENAYNECRIKAFESIAGLCDPFHHRLRKYTEPCIESNPAFW